MLRSPRLFGATCAAFVSLSCASEARAFCGFYVSGADTKLQNDATQVVLMRKGTRTVLSMQNDYKGPAKDFAMVVPVPIVLQKENVKTLPRDVFAHVDQLSAPRLVEYWEKDPCAEEGLSGEGIGLGNIGTIGFGAGFGSGSGRGFGVTVEAQFAVGEYEIVILGAKDSSGLDGWLRANGYKIPDKAEEALRPYVQAGAKFFVAKVDVSKVKLTDGRAELSPLRFHYDSEKFELPVRLGMINSGGTQDLVVQILAPNQRYEVASYPNVTIPTNLDVAEAARGRFGEFYAALLDRTLEKNPGAIVTEYAWGATSCDPCPGNIQGLSAQDVETLGGDVIDAPSGPVGKGVTGADAGGAAAPVATQAPGATQAPVAGTAPLVTFAAPVVKGRLPPEVVRRIMRQNVGRQRLCYERALRADPKLAGTVTIGFDIAPDGSVGNLSRTGGTMKSDAVASCVTRSMMNLSFPQPEGGKVRVEQTLTFAPTGGSGVSMLGGGISRGGWGGRGAGMVLTRLHMRYAANALGADLVFREAKPIVGGRESRGADGALEHGAAPSESNAFQGRYAIRHAWPGKITCDKPQRGRWGGPWPDAGVADHATKAATKTAYAPRGGISLASLVAADIPEIAVTAAAASSSTAGPELDGGLAPPAKKTSRCGCEVVGAREAPRAGLVAALLAAALTALRRAPARGPRRGAPPPHDLPSSSRRRSRP